MNALSRTTLKLFPYYVTIHGFSCVAPFSDEGARSDAIANVSDCDPNYREPLNNDPLPKTFVQIANAKLKQGSALKQIEEVPKDNACRPWFESAFKWENNQWTLAAKDLIGPEQKSAMADVYLKACFDGQKVWQSHSSIVMPWRVSELQIRHYYESYAPLSLGYTLEYPIEICPSNFFPGLLAQAFVGLNSARAFDQLALRKIERVGKDPQMVVDRWCFHQAKADNHGTDTLSVAMLQKKRALYPEILYKTTIVSFKDPNESKQQQNNIRESMPAIVLLTPYRSTSRDKFLRKYNSETPQIVAFDYGPINLSTFPNAVGVVPIIRRDKKD